MVSGNNDWGTDANDEAKLLGTDDTPVVAGGVKFDPHRILVVGVSVDTEWLIRIIWGTGTMADAITAGQYSLVMVKFDALTPELSAGIPIEVRTEEIDVGTKMWAQAWNVTDNATIDFYLGIHEYFRRS